MTEKELDEFLLTNMCRTEKWSDKFGVERIRIFHILLSDVFHKMETIFGRFSEKYMDELLYIGKARNTLCPELHYQSKELKNHIYNIIVKYKEDKQKTLSTDS